MQPDVIHHVSKASTVPAKAPAHRVAGQLDPCQRAGRCLVTREPGGTPLAEQLRAHFLRDAMDALTEAC